MGNFTVKKSPHREEGDAVEKRLGWGVAIILFFLLIAQFLYYQVTMKEYKLACKDYREACQIWEEKYNQLLRR